MPPSPSRFPRACCAALVALVALAACSASGASDGGSTRGSGSGTSGGGSSGGAVFALSDAGPASTQEICQWLWAGQTRFALVFFQPALVGEETGPYCPSPTPAQGTALAQMALAAAPGIVTLEPPDGGWPDGSGPTVCDDPSSALSTLAAEIAQSLAAGHSAWDAPALSACRRGLQESGELTAWGEALGGSFTGEADTIGSPDGGGPCFTVLQGQVRDGGSCLFPFECQAGLYCRSAGDGGSCAGSCAPLVPASDPCGPLDECAGGASCFAGLCGGPDAGPLKAGDAGTPCASSNDCQGCLFCTSPRGSNLPTCQSGLPGSPCTSDADCATPLLYCGLQGSCTPSLPPGQPCVVSSPFECLDGWCDPVSGACRPYSNVGGPCAASADCLGGYCANGPDGGSCVPLPAEGDPCGPPPLSAACADSQNDYCAIPDGGGSGSCAALPGSGKLCLAGRCAAGLVCDLTTTCRAPPGLGESCPEGVCQAAYRCVAGQCVTPLPGGASCATYGECASDDCLPTGDGGVCTSPCGAEGLAPSLLSLLLGLGGA